MVEHADEEREIDDAVGNIRPHAGVIEE